MDKKRKSERNDWILYKVLRREEDIVKNHRKPQYEQKMSYTNDIMFSISGLAIDNAWERGRQTDIAVGGSGENRIG